MGTWTEPSCLPASRRVKHHKAVGDIASICLPIETEVLNLIVKALEKAYGEGLVYSEQPDGWLTISTAEKGD